MEYNDTKGDVDIYLGSYLDEWIEKLNSNGKCFWTKEKSNILEYNPITKIKMPAINTYMNCFPQTFFAVIQNFEDHCNCNGWMISLFTASLVHT